MSLEDEIMDGLVDPEAPAETATAVAPETVEATPEVAPVAEPLTYNKDTHILVERGTFENDDFHAAKKALKDYQQMKDDGSVEFFSEVGMTGRELLDKWNQPEESVETDTLTYPAEPTPLTAETVAALIAESNQTILNQLEQKQVDAVKQQALNAAFVAESAAATEALGGIGVKFEDGKAVSKFGEFATTAFYNAVNSVVKSQIPSHFTEEQKRQALQQPATADQLGLATASFNDMMADVKTRLVAEAAEQQTTSTDSLQQAPGGSAPPKNPSQMTEKEKYEHVMEGMED